MFLVAVASFVGGASWIHPGLGVMAVAAITIMVLEVLE